MIYCKNYIKLFSRQAMESEEYKEMCKIVVRQINNRKDEPNNAFEHEKKNRIGKPTKDIQCNDCFMLLTLYDLEEKIEPKNLLCGEMIEQGFNYVDSTIKEMTDFFETRVQNLKPKEDKKKSSAAAKKFKESHKKRKREDSDSKVVESSKESTKAHHTNKKYCILHNKCSHSKNNCKDLCAMVSKHKQKKKKKKI